MYLFMDVNALYILYILYIEREIHINTYVYIHIHIYINIYIYTIYIQYIYNIYLYTHTHTHTYIKETNFDFLLSACHTLKAIFLQTYSNIFRTFSYSQMYTETGAFSTQNFRTSFKDAIARGKLKLYQ